MEIAVSGEKKRIRENFRSSVFSRDGHKCRVCGVSGVELDAHHICDRNEMENGGYVKENGITLCNVPGGCHEKAECYHQLKPVPPGYMPKDLYDLIGSSLEKAIAASKCLK